MIYKFCVTFFESISVIWAHHRLIENNCNQSFQALLITLILALYFTIL